MPEYRTPGVYVEEVPAAIEPIAGVGTGSAGFVGAVADDVAMRVIPRRAGDRPADRYAVPEAGVAQLVTGWEQFRRRFGDIQAGNATLAHAVYGFFNNGGGR